MTRAIFVDMYGVLMDPAKPPAQWHRLVGELWAPRLGGEPGAWGRANAYAAERMWARYRDPGGTPRETHPRLRRLWFREMCEHVGVPTPRDAGEKAQETFSWVNERLDASFPDTAETVRALKAAGHRLFTSAAPPSQDVRAFLRSLAVEELFEETYGSDIVDRWKTNSGFYRKVLEHSGVAAADAITIDDQEKCLDWAKRAGFSRTFLVAPPGTISSHETIAALAELLARL